MSIAVHSHETLPNTDTGHSWYKRADDDMWTLNDIVISTAQQCASYPSACKVGGNTGTTNSFTGFDLGNLSGGFVNTVADLSDPAKMGCFISQAIQADVPGFLDNVFEGGALVLAKSQIATTLVPALAGLGSCQNTPKGKSIFAYGAQFPGAQFAQNGNRAPY